MTREQIFTRIQEVLVESFETPRARITLEAKLIDDLELDSIDAIDMAVRIQDITKVRVDEEALKQLATVKDVIDLVERLLAQGAESAPSAE